METKTYPSAVNNVLNVSELMRAPNCLLLLLLGKGVGKWNWGSAAVIGKWLLELLMLGLGAAE